MSAGSHSPENRKEPEASLTSSETVAVNQVTMNKTLSLIEEENEDDFFTNDDINSGAPHHAEGSRTALLMQEASQINRSLPSREESLLSVSNKSSKRFERSSSSSETLNAVGTSSSKSLLVPAVPNILKDVETIERDFTAFLEQIYN